MYVCICNALKDKDFERASTACKRAQCAEDLFDELGCKPVCGSCMCKIDDLLPSAVIAESTQPNTTL